MCNSSRVIAILESEALQATMWWMKSARDTLTSHPQPLGRKLDKAFPGKNAATRSDVIKNISFSLTSFSFTIRKQSPPREVFPHTCVCRMPTCLTTVQPWHTHSRTHTESPVSLCLHTHAALAGITSWLSDRITMECSPSHMNECLTHYKT